MKDSQQADNSEEMHWGEPPSSPDEKTNIPGVDTLIRALLASWEQGAEATAVEQQAVVLLKRYCELKPLLHRLLNTPDWARIQQLQTTLQQLQQMIQPALPRADLTYREFRLLGDLQFRIQEMAKKMKYLFSVCQPDVTPKHKL